MAAAAAPTRPEAAAPQLLDTQHEDHVHDVAWDYYARRLATCSSDGTVKIFAADGEAFTWRARRLAASDPYQPADPRQGRQVYRAGGGGDKK